MKFVAGLSFLASLAAAVSVDANKRDSPLDVKLELVGNTGVKALITNSGSSALKLLKVGTLLDKQPVEKVEIHAAGSYIQPTLAFYMLTPSHRQAGCLRWHPLPDQYRRTNRGILPKPRRRRDCGS